MIRSTNFWLLHAAALVLFLQGIAGEACFETGYFPAADWKYCKQLDSNIFMYYSPLKDEGNVKLGFHAMDDSFGWTALALAGNGGMKGASQIVVRKDDTDEWIAEDRNSQDYVTPTMDNESQDVELIFADQTQEGETAWGVLLMMDSCDYPFDYPISDLSIFMHWALGSDHSFMYHGTRRGQFHVNLLGAPEELPDTDDLEVLSFLMPDVPVVLGEGGTDPSNPYICSYFDLEVMLPGNRTFTDKTHVIRIAPELNEDSKKYVHHMLLFSCSADGEGDDDADADADDDFDDDDSVNFETVEHLQIVPECQSMPGCHEIKMVWAVGGAELVLPQEVGLPIGEGNRWLALQIHYYNPNLDANISDSSGMKAYLSPDLREQDAGLMEIDGGTDPFQRSPLPAGMTDYELPSYVIPSGCTASEWKSPLTILGVIHHMHLTGKRMEIVVERDGENLGGLRRDTYFDFKHQSLEPSPLRTLLPGDSLTMKCSYDTSSATEDVSFGDLTQQEMCYGAIIYYPRQLEESFFYIPLPTYPNATGCLSPGTGDWAESSGCAQSFYENVPAFFGEKTMDPFDALVLCNADWFEDEASWIFPDMCPPCYTNKNCTAQEIAAHAQTDFCVRWCQELRGVSVYPDASRTEAYNMSGWGCPEEYARFQAPQMVPPPTCQKVGNVTVIQHVETESAGSADTSGGSGLGGTTSWVSAIATAALFILIS